MLIIMSLLVRGPFYSLILVMLLFFFINFRKLFWKTIYVTSFIAIIIIASGLHVKLLELTLLEGYL